MTPTRIALLTLIALGTWTYGAFLGDSDLLNPDEPRYATIARGMLESGDWLVPRLAERPYSEKPPLFFWCAALAGAARGDVDEFAARLPSVLAAVGTLVLTFWIPRRLFADPRTAFFTGVIAAALLGTSARFLVLASRANIDALLAFWTTTAFAAFVRGLPPASPPSAGPVPASIAWQALGFALAGVSVLTKGVGAALFLLGLAAWAWIGARPEPLARRIAWGPGLAALSAVIAAWALPLVFAAPDGYPEAIFFRQTVTRLVDPWTHTRSATFYFRTLPLNFLPWTTLLPLAAWSCWRTFRHGTDDPDRRGVAFAATLFLTMFAFFTLLPAKRDYYLLPALPWLSILVGWTAARALAPSGDGATGLRRTLWTIAGLHALGGLALWAWPLLPAEARPPFAGRGLPEHVLSELAGPAQAVGALALGGAVAATLFLRRGRMAAAGLALVLVLLPSWNLYRGAVRPAVAALSSARKLGTRLAELSREDDVIVAFGPYEEGIPYYSRRPVESLPDSDPAALAARLSASPRLLVVTTRTGERILRESPSRLSLNVLAEGRIGNDDYVILARRK